MLDLSWLRSINNILKIILKSACQILHSHNCIPQHFDILCLWIQSWKLIVVALGINIGKYLVDKTKPFKILLHISFKPKISIHATLSQIPQQPLSKHFKCSINLPILFQTIIMFKFQNWWQNIQQWLHCLCAQSHFCLVFGWGWFF